MANKTLIRMTGITKNFPGVVANNNVDFNLHPSEIHSILGENGAGKTTLIKHFNGLYQPTTGEVSFKGRCIRSLHPSARAVAVGVCFQNPNDQFFETDVRKEILAGENIRETIEAILNEMVEDIVATFCPEKTPATEWNWETLAIDFANQFNFLPELPEPDKDLKPEELEILPGKLEIPPNPTFDEQIKLITAQIKAMADQKQLSLDDVDVLLRHYHSEGVSVLAPEVA